MSSFTRFSKTPAMYYNSEESDKQRKDLWSVMEGFTYYVNNKEDDDNIIVPSGYLTDGASVPRVFWSLIPPWGRYGAAAIVHDYLCDGNPIRRYSTNVNNVRVYGNYYPNRKEANKIFNQAMKVLKVPRFTRWTMYTAVRIYGIFKPLNRDKSNGIFEVK